MKDMLCDLSDDKTITAQDSPERCSREKKFLAVRPGISIVLVWLVTLSWSAPALAEGAASDEMVLFAFDDHSIPFRDNLHITLEQARKHPGNPVLRAGPPGAPDHGQACIYGTVLHLDGKFRMWYSGAIEESMEAWKESWRPMCYAESNDGVNWVKPNLGLVDIKGSRKNNACLIEGGDEQLTRVDDSVSVIYDLEDPDPRRRYKCVYIVHPIVDKIKGGIRDLQKGRRHAMMVTAVSADGLRWQVVGDRPAVAEKFEVHSLYKFGGFYYASGQQVSPWTWRFDGSKANRFMMTFRSSDFVNWSTASTISFARPVQLLAKPIEEHQSQTHMAPGIWNRGNVLLGLYGMWDDGLNAQRPKGSSPMWGLDLNIGLVVSTDGIHFREPVADFKVVEHGKKGEWDEEQIFQGNAFANVDDKTLIWYSASHWSDDTTRNVNPHIGLATLRRDSFGYLSLHRPQAAGHCVTRALPPTTEPREVFINVSGVAAQQPITVELLDEADRPLADYSGQNAAVIASDSVRAPVTWPKTKSHRLPSRRTVALRINFPAGGKAKVYATYIDSPTQSHRK